MTDKNTNTEIEKNINKSFEENSKFFEEKTIYISAGAIGLLVNIFDKITNITYCIKYIYLICVFSFAISLLLNIWSYHIGIENTRELSTNNKEGITKHNKFTSKINSFSLFFFTIGIVFVGILLIKIIKIYE